MAALPLHLTPKEDADVPVGVLVPLIDPKAEVVVTAAPVVGLTGAIPDTSEVDVMSALESLAAVGVGLQYAVLFVVKQPSP
jgi:hypothetical protein